MLAHYKTLRSWPQWGGAALVGAVGLIAYWPTLFFNFFWEDPFDIGQVEPFSYLQLLGVANSNSYYRPLALVILKALKLSGPAYDPFPYHLFVVVGHLVSGMILFGLARHLFARTGKSNLYPLAAGLLYVLYPLPYEATARASSMHEWLTAAMFASFWLYAWGRSTQRRWPLLTALLLMALAQTVHENGLLFPALVVVLEVWLAWQRRVPRWSPAALLYTLPALAFFVVWLAIPKAGEAPQLGLHLREALYLSQAISFPIAGPIAWLGGLGLSPEWQAGLALLGALGVLIAVHGRARAHRLALALAWWVLAISLAWIARPIEYLRVSPRVMYFASFGAVLAWAGVADFGNGRPAGQRLRRIVGAGLLAAVLAQSAFVLARATTLYRRGSELMTEIIAAGADGGRLLFINVPDRFAYRDPPYPMGYWGMLLAPVSQNLADFISFSTGVPTETESLSDFQLLAAQVDASPYQVNTRGVDAFASAALYEAALRADATYVVAYLPDGRLELAEVGTISPARRAAAALAEFGNGARLLAGTARADGRHVTVQLEWAAESAPQPNDTIFVHLLDENGALVAQADGDSLGGLIAASAWRAEHVIRDRRVLILDAAAPPGGYHVAAGMYSRVDGSRYTATAADGAPFPDGAARIATVFVDGDS